MPENEAWCSGESEPENEVLKNEDIGEIDSEYFYYNGTQSFKDAQFYPLIKDFEGSSEINPNITFSENRPIDFFNYFFDSSLVQKIVGEKKNFVTLYLDKGVVWCDGSKKSVFFFHKSRLKHV